MARFKCDIKLLKALGDAFAAAIQKTGNVFLGARTRSGTNDFQGEAFGTYTADQFEAAMVWNDTLSTSISSRLQSQLASEA